MLKSLALSASILAMLGTAPGLVLASSITPAHAPQGFADVVAPLLPSVVNISTENGLSSIETSPIDPSFSETPLSEDLFRDFMERLQPDDPMAGKSVGSGFIIDSQGYIVTNNHLVEDASRIRITFHDNTETEARLIGRDPRTDLALLKVDVPQKLTPAQWGSASSLRTGDWIIAIGNPFGLGGSVTTGIVSHVGRSISKHEGAGSADFVSGYIQTDASINLGNSGGPMFDMQGRVVGVNRAIYSMNGGNIGISFAIPEDTARKVIDQLRQYGRTKRGWIGVQIRPVTEDIADSLGLKNVQGAFVGNVVSGSPAEKAGVKMGDIITKLGDMPLSENSNFPRMIANLPVGSKSTLTLLRRGKHVHLSVNIGEFEKAQEDGLFSKKTTPELPSPKGTHIEGLTLQSLTTEVKHSFALPLHLEGALIADVKPTSEAFSKGLRPGDIITEVSQDPVKSPDDVTSAINKALAMKRKSVLLLINRDGDVRYVALKISLK